jgi:transglutaminase-like putative cysteine protease
MFRPGKFVVSLVFIAFAVTLGLPAGHAQAAAPWPPVPPEELALKDNAFEPGSPAMILEYEVQTDNTRSTETIYKRIKIFREEGRKFADVEIRYVEKFTKVEEIRARVTSPAGKAEDFSGAIYDKEIVKAKKFLYNAKTLTLSSVEVGSVIEYSYRLHWHSDIPDVFKNPERYIIVNALAYPAAEWEIQEEIPVRHGRFTLRPIKGTSPRFYSNGLPQSVTAHKRPDGTQELEVNYIPAFVKEEYSAPEENLKVRADLFYTLGYNDFWEGEARREAEYYDKFMGKPKDVRNVLEGISSLGDSDETKLRKIYKRVQQIRALHFEPEKTKKERQQESLKENKSAQDVLTRGYAFGNEINLAFIALARAAGFQAYPVRLAARNRSFFVEERFDPYQLNSLVVEVKTGSTTKLIDPATVYCPYDLLPWEEAGARGIRADALNSAVETTPSPTSKDAVVRREAEFQLDAEGNLSGNLLVVYEGQEALQRRLLAIDQDEAERRKALEGQVQSLLPQGGRAKLLSAQGWTDSETPLKAEFEIQVPSYANKAGKRLLIPVGIFHSSGQQPFSSTRRTYAVYFDYPWESYEQVKLAIPDGFQVESLPGNTKIDRGRTTYESSSSRQGSILQLNRTMKMAAYYVPLDKYPLLKQFYELIRAGDEQQVVLKPVSSAEKQ